MRKIFSFLAVSADGYHADPGRGLAWQTLGPEFADYSVEQLDEVDTLATVEALAEFKQTPGKDAAVLGSSTLTGALLRAGLVDEVRLMVNPIILGGGLRAFETAGTVPLRLIRTRPFTAGNVLLYYRPDFTGR